MVSAQLTGKGKLWALRYEDRCFNRTIALETPAPQILRVLFLV